MKPTLRDVGIMAIVTVAVMAIVSRWSVARRVILPGRRPPRERFQFPVIRPVRPRPIRPPRRRFRFPTIV